MNKFFRVLFMIFNVVISILALAFLVIEGRLLFSGEWLIYDSAFDGFIRYLFRTLLCIVTISKGVIEFAKLSDKEDIQEYLFYGDIALVIMSIIILKTLQKIKEKNVLPLSLVQVDKSLFEKALELEVINVEQQKMLNN